MRFTVRETSSGERAEVIYNDQDGNATISAGDELFLVARGEQGTPLLTWAITFSGVGNVVPPAPRDTFVLKTNKPFTSRDVFEFNPVRSTAPAARRVDDGGHFLLRAYPNPCNQATVIICTGSGAGPAVLEVYDVCGRRVRHINLRLEALGPHRVRWDGRDDRDLPVPSGVYVVLMRAGSSRGALKVVLMR